MISLQGIRSSSKTAGVYETPVIDALAIHFVSQGYEVLSRASLNIAWGSILSDVDLIAAGKGHLVAVEVKSRHDNISRVSRQIEKLMSYFDFVYLATERRVEKHLDQRIGLLEVGREEVREIREAKELTQRPTLSSLTALHRICLERIVGTKRNHLSKLDLAQEAYGMTEDPQVRECLKEIISCSRTCQTRCPIWAYDFASG